MGGKGALLTPRRAQALRASMALPSIRWLVWLALIASLAPGAVSAQGLWSRWFGGATTSPTAPCALDRCDAVEPPAKDAPAAPPRAQAALPSAMPPGNFDFYLLTLSWSPGF